MFKQLMLASVAGFVLTIGTAGLPITETGIVGAPPAHAFLGKIKKAAKKVGKGIKKGAKKVGSTAKRVGKHVGGDLKKVGKNIGRRAKHHGKMAAGSVKMGAKAVGKGVKTGVNAARDAGGFLATSTGVTAGMIVFGVGKAIDSDRMARAGMALADGAAECLADKGCRRRLGDAALTGGQSEIVRGYARGAKGAAKLIGKLGRGKIGDPPNVPTARRVIGTTRINNGRLQTRVLRGNQAGGSATARLAARGRILQPDANKNTGIMPANGQKNRVPKTIPQPHGGTHCYYGSPCIKVKYKPQQHKAGPRDGQGKMQGNVVDKRRVKSNRLLKKNTRILRSKIVKRPTVDGRTVARRKLQSTKILRIKKTRARMRTLPKLKKSARIKKAAIGSKRRMLRKRNVKRNVRNLRRVERKTLKTPRVGRGRAQIRRSTLRKRGAARRSFNARKFAVNKTGGGQRRRRR